ncbi:Dicer-like protein 2-2, partial [Frankliniella fusca]
MMTSIRLDKKKTNINQYTKPF